MHGPAHSRDSPVSGSVRLDAALHGERRGSRLPAGLLRPDLPSFSTVGELALALPIGGSSLQAILLDIEGMSALPSISSTDLISLRAPETDGFLVDHREDPAVRDDIDALRKQHAKDANEQLNPPRWIQDTQQAEVASATEYALWLMDRDSKCAALKSLQGKIWQDGYQMGELYGEVYPEVPAALARWVAQGKTVCIFSSGSVLAQKLLFGSTAAGDLIASSMRTSIPRWDQALAGKLCAYCGNAGDHAGKHPVYFRRREKIDAAQEAGMRTALCERTELAGRSATTHPVIHTFDGILTGK